MKATKEWKEEVRTIGCFNKMIETGLNIKNKSISYSSGEWEIQYEADLLSGQCSVTALKLAS